MYRKIIAILTTPIYLTIAAPAGATHIALEPETQASCPQASEIDLLREENAKLHMRLDLNNKRFAHIEYYLGMRQHSFEDGERRWDFQQVKKDAVNDGRPRSRETFNRKQRAHHRAAA